MKTLKKTFLLFLFINLILVSCKKKAEEKQKIEEVMTNIKVAKSTLTNKAQRIPRDFKVNERKKYKDKNKENLDVIKIESFYNFKHMYLNLKIPVDDKKFRIHKIEWFEKNGIKGLFVGMSNKNKNTTRGKLGKYLLEEEFEFSKIKGTLTLNNNENLVVFTFNDESMSNSSTNINEIIKALEYIVIDGEGKFILPPNYKNNNSPFIPKESGGGVIVVGP